MPYVAIDYSKLQSPSTALREARNGTLTGHLGMTPRTAALAMEMGGIPSRYVPLSAVAKAAATPAYAPASSSTSSAPQSIDQRMQLANAQIAAFLAPGSAVIDRLPNPPYYANFTQDLKTRPIDAMLNLLSPIQNLIQDSINIANARSGVSSRRIGLPGTPQVDVVMGLDVPAVVTNPTDREALKRLMIVNNFMILGTQAPGFMARGIAEALVNEIARGGARAADALLTAKSLVQAAVSSGIPLGAWAPMAPTSAMLKALVAELKSRIPLAFPPVVDPAALRRKIIDWAKTHLPWPQETYTVQEPARFPAPAPPYKAGDIIPAGWAGHGTVTVTKTRNRPMNDEDWFQLGKKAPGVPLSGMGGLGVLPAVAAAAAPPAAAGGVTAGAAAAESTGVAVAPPLSSIVIGGFVTAATAAAVAAASKATDKAVDKASSASDRVIDTATNIDLNKDPNAKPKAPAATPAPAAPAQSSGSGFLPVALAAGAVLAFPLVGPLAAGALAVAAAASAFKKKPAPPPPPAPPPGPTPVAGLLPVHWGR